MPLNVVSGCPRSGTSLMMKILRTTFGEERIIGRALFTPPTTPGKKYLYDKATSKKELERREKAKDMNPQGFWEMEWTVKGVAYDPSLNERLKEADGKFVKIVSQGLFKTEPSYIERVVFMLRNPRNVAKSQERLSRDLDTSALGQVHSPAMFVNVTIQAARWFVSNPEIPVLVVNYDELLDGRCFDALASFLGEGNWEEGKKCVDPNLNRSKPEPVENDLWEIANKIYELASEKDWKGIVEYANARAKAVSEVEFFCPRRGMNTSGNFCKLCKEGRPQVIHNFKIRANKKNVDWTNEPCLWDVEFNPEHEGPRPTIEESIQDNHWKKAAELSLRQKVRLGSKLEKAIAKVPGVKKLPCYDEEGQLRPESGCAKRKRLLNGDPI